MLPVEFQFIFEIVGDSVGDEPVRVGAPEGAKLSKGCVDGVMHILVLLVDMLSIRVLFP